MERMGSCQVVHRGGTRRSCVSGRCGWSQRSAVSTIRSGQRSVRSPVYLVLAARRRCVSGPHPVSRQTQNPERGRKLYHSRPNRYRRVQVVRPKTPRGDGNILSANSSTVPLSGRQTQNPERGRKRPVDGGCVVRASVVRPKTPRGDGNPTMASKSAWVTDPGRQTQNPERGRKLVRHLCLIQVQCPVVRPKTPRGDGNLTARSFPASIR